MRRWIGPTLFGIGALVLTAGVVGVVGGGVDAAAPASTTVAAISNPSTTTVPPTTTTVPPTTSPTTTTVPDETVEQFIERFSQALEDGDRDFVFERLHPVTIDGWGAELCSSWVDREIMSLSQYSLNGAPEGPSDRQISTPDGTATVPDYYTAPVRFVFQGTAFEQIGAFALIAPDLYWLGKCR